MAELFARGQSIQGELREAKPVPGQLTVEQFLLRLGKQGPRSSQQYVLTAAGKKAFKNWLLSEPGPDHLRSPLILRLVHAGSLTAKQRQALVDSARASYGAEQEAAKTAVKLIEQFGSVEEMLDHTDQITSAKQRALVEELGSLRRSIDQLLRIDPTQGGLQELYDGAYYSLQELGERLERYALNVEHDPVRLEAQRPAQVVEDVEERAHHGRARQPGGMAQPQPRAPAATAIARHQGEEVRLAAPAARDEEGDGPGRVAGGEEDPDARVTEGDLRPIHRHDAPRRTRHPRGRLRGAVLDELPVGLGEHDLRTVRLL